MTIGQIATAHKLKVPYYVYIPINVFRNDLDRQSQQFVPDSMEAWIQKRMGAQYGCEALPDVGSAHR